MALVWLDSPVKKQTLYDTSGLVSSGRHVGIIVLDNKGCVVQMNNQAENIVGMQRNQVINKQYNDGIHAILSMENTFRFENLCTISNDQTHQVTIRRDGGDQVEIEVSVLPTHPSNKETSGYILVLCDRESIERKVEEKIRNERLTAMSEITASIAHEVRNPLGCIELFASSLKNSANPMCIDEQVETISKCIKTINGILSNITYFFESEYKPSFSIVDVHEHLNESLSFSKYLFQDTADIAIRSYFSEEKLIINGDNELLKQMSMNILLNSFQAIKEAGTIEIRTRKFIDNMSGIEFVELFYADTGSGINESHLTKVFDPYFTTKNMGKGLGLAIVNNIVRLHDGSIQIKRRKSKGTKVSILIPLAGNQYSRNAA